MKIRKANLLEKRLCKENTKPLSANVYAAEEAER